MTDITQSMRDAVAKIATDADVDPSTVHIEFALTDDSDPWVVRIEMRKVPKRGSVQRTSAFGHGETIADAAADSIDDMASWTLIGFERHTPTGWQ